MVKKHTRFFNMADIFRDAAKKLVPELIDREDFDAEYQHGLSCPGCNEHMASALFYRLHEQTEWLRAGEIMHCSSCRGTETFKSYQKNSLQEQQLEIGERLMKEYFLIPEDLTNAGFKNYFQSNNVTGRAKEECMQYVKSFLAGQRHNLLIMGNPGTGKSHLCAAIGRTLKGHNFIVGFLTTGTLLRKIKSTYSKGANKTEEDIFRDLKRFDLLILDDVGSEAKSNDEWREGMLFEIVNSRIGKPTIYTSNLTDKDLPIAVGKRVFSRLYNNTKFIDVFTDDYRKTLKRA